MDRRRLTRLEGDIRLKLMDILQRDVSDPRLSGVFITGLRLSRDASHATVLYEPTSGSEEDAEDAITAASGYIRSRLASVLSLRTVPALSFHLDRSGERSEDVLRTIRRMERE